MNVVKAIFSDGTEIVGTDIHPVWSVDRQDWIALGELQEYERVQTRSGTIHLVSLQAALPADVFNIEVDCHHVYEVGDAGVLVHNACGEQTRDAFGRFMRKNGDELAPGSRAVDDFMKNFSRNDYRLLKGQTTVNTPFGVRRYDALLEDLRSGKIIGVEIKSSMAALMRNDQLSRQQKAIDRWINLRGGAQGSGASPKFFVDEIVRIMWNVE